MGQASGEPSQAGAMSGAGQLVNAEPVQINQGQTAMNVGSERVSRGQQDGSMLIPQLETNPYPHAYSEPPSTGTNP